MDIKKIEDVKIKSAGDFKILITGLNELGITRFKTNSCTGITTYFNSKDEVISDVNASFDFTLGDLDVDTFISNLEIHQSGEMDFVSWVENTAKSGIAYWIVDIKGGSCTYYDKTDQEVYIEKIN